MYIEVYIGVRCNIYTLERIRFVGFKTYIFDTFCFIFIFFAQFYGTSKK